MGVKGRKGIHHLLFYLLSDFSVVCESCSLRSFHSRRKHLHFPPFSLSPSQPSKPFFPPFPFPFPFDCWNLPRAKRQKKGSTSLFLNRSGKEQKDKKEGGPLFRGRPLRDLICMSRCCLLPPSSFLFSPSPGYRWRRRRKGGRTEVIIGFPLPRGRPPPPSFLSSSKVRGEGREGTKAEEVSPANGAGMVKDLNNFKLNNNNH